MELRIYNEDTDHQGAKGSWASGLLTIIFAAAALFLLPAGPAQAAGSSITVTETVETFEYTIVAPERSSDWTSAPSLQTLGRYGPFRVVSSDTAEMSGTVDSDSPMLFRQMLKQHPGIKRIQMIDCDGSVDEAANLSLARQIRHAGISTHVPAHGSVRSGAVELFLAGVRHTADKGAEFVVHSWMDEDGREANDYPPDDPVHSEYLSYYTEMGIPADKAQAFYALTNSVPFAEQLKLSRNDLARFQLLH
ncbi:alpha/beta hydrolase [Parasphingorhabdus cellanae]|uniref:Alpha/beta hydrolase n=1 Tax=Parasphingorhabdus cellanae TaxID=2806553 RepID=A0ABX7T3T2_9SPHN|nr:alpha/beta hydrolase [Parasphingorhabdus cellanae]QTD54643.1 alpha/beta hydrolase [Parasphingorhabdus cellanae]